MCFLFVIDPVLSLISCYDSPGPAPHPLEPKEKGGLHGAFMAKLKEA